MRVVMACSACDVDGLAFSFDFDSRKSNDGKKPVKFVVNFRWCSFIMEFILVFSIWNEAHNFLIRHQSIINKRIIYMQCHTCFFSYFVLD